MMEKGTRAGSQLGPTALTKPAKISGKEALPKSASETKPQAESITTENKSQRGRDDSAHKPGPVTGGVLNVAKNGKFEPKDNVEQALSGYAEKTSNLDDKKIEVKAVSESPQVLKDLTKQGSISGSKIPTSDRLSANGEVSLLSKLEPLNDASARSKKQTFKPSPEASNILNSSLKRHNLTKGRSKDEWSVPQNRDTPSSWLDLDFPKQRLKVSSEAKLTSSGSESNLLDTSADLDDADFVEKIKKLCAPFSLPPRKHNPLRNPQPPFAMPAIKEDRYEKTFDPDEFTFGLRKTNKFSFETPSLLAKLQNPEGKPSVKPARASFADRSMLLSGLESRFRDKAPSKDEKEEAKDEVKDEIKVKSRLEGSCVLNSLTTSSFRSKLSQSQAQADGTNSGNVSPSGSPQNNSPRQLVPPPPAQANPEARNKKEEIQCAGELAESDSGPPLPAFNQIKLPDFLEKYLPRETREQGQREPGKLQRARTEVDSKMPSVKEEARSSSPRESPVHTQLHTQAAVKKPTLAESTQSTPKELHAEKNKAPVKMPSPAGPAEEPSVTNAMKLPPSLTNHFSGISLTDQAPPRHAPPKRRPSSKIRPAKGSHTRPGKMLLFEKAPFEGQVYEVHRDVEDATFMQFSPLVSVRVVRGCWILYEKPGFQGRTIALEEGGLELANVWAQPEPGPGLDPGLDPDLDPQVPMQIGSIRLAVSDYALPHIDLFTEPEGRGRVTPYHDDIVETGSFGIPLSTSSIQVHSGVWLVFSDPGFQGMLAVLETGVYPFPETWGFPSPFVGSLRPLKMGGFKVENPNEVKAVVFEKAAFEGPSVETETDVFCFGEEDGGQDAALQCVGSLKILGGLWVGYSEPGFEGQQYILEEGEYLRCEDWGGAEILSLRPIMSDFMSPHLKMFSDADFGALGVNIDLTVPVINLDETGYGLKTQSMDVLSGVWVVFEEPGFSGESFLLEKGQYGNPEDWGSKRPTVASAMPVVLENFETTAKFKVQLFPEADFRGSALVLEDSEGSLPPGFSVGSCKVLAGSWLAFEGQEFSGRMYVLDEGSYPDLRAMGCVHASATILSLQVVGFEFSLPSIVLFERCGLKGKRLVLSDGEVNLLMSGGGGRVQSVLVEGGMWVLYEEINYRGAQMLLRPGEVSDWRSFSGWKKVGSLRPLLQKQVHFHIRSRQSGHLMTVTGDLDDIKLLRVQEMEESQGFEQIWFFQSGHLRCKLLEECCLCPSSSVTIAGARVGLAPALDDTAHLWNIAPDGVIAYSASPNLVLEVKGGHNYDKTQVVLNTRDPKRLQQQWVIEVL
ncbi:beta/gamma crystallin domain-containing protein 1-like [Boleophthalmus pectinirostris]|uniref:beta/gamma crystallin domain-containing protein 1-like n=1 Tax=Boleophthalmus pectinirostris TaxID=150288 RepID=UPI0024304125|nr:beta/gamma crystallin domain-containing protein 1-like [Boleophthalmus pectinirostris]